MSMKTAVMGSGGVGGYFGARLAAAGNDVTFIARGAHLEAIRSEGLRVQSPKGNVHVNPAAATNDPAEVGPVDVVLFATKLYDTESAGEQCKPFIGDETAVISLLNGVDSEQQLSHILGAAYQRRDRSTRCHQASLGLRQYRVRRARRPREHSIAEISFRGPGSRHRRFSA
jgi:2-dehydropantoate 2-reductase